MGRKYRDNAEARLDRISAGRQRGVSNILGGQAFSSLHVRKGVQGHDWSQTSGDLVQQPIIASDCQNWTMAHDLLWFKHRKVTPLCPRANGEVDRSVKTMKKCVEAAKSEGKNWRKNASVPVELPHHSSFNDGSCTSNTVLETCCSQQATAIYMCRPNGRDRSEA